MKSVKFSAGVKFGMLTVIEYAGSVPNGKATQSAYRCKCDCGNESIVHAYKLSSGRTKSCGCQIAVAASKNTGATARHGHSSGGLISGTYKSWFAMIQRCTNKNNSRFSSYGGRGISVCERWMKFDNFLEDMGERPDDMTIDRVDVNGNYEKANCRWADRITQAANKRNSLSIHKE